LGGIVASASFSYYKKKMKLQKEKPSKKEGKKLSMDDRTVAMLNKRMRLLKITEPLKDIKSDVKLDEGVKTRFFMTLKQLKNLIFRFHLPILLKTRGNR